MSRRSSPATTRVSQSRAIGPTAGCSDHLVPGRLGRGGSGRGAPELDEPRAGTAQVGEEPAQARVVRVARRGHPQVGDEAGDLLVVLLGCLDRARPAADDVAPHGVAIVAPQRRGLAHQRVVRGVRHQEVPRGVVDRDGDAGPPVEEALEARRDPGRDDSRARRGQACEPEEQVALGVGQAQSTGECLDHLGGRRRRTALLQARQVVHRDAREPGELLAAQAGRATTPADREPDDLRRDAVAPAAHRRAELRAPHAPSVRARAVAVLALAVLRTADDCLGVRTGPTIDT